MNTFHSKVHRAAQTSISFALAAFNLGSAIAAGPAPANPASAPPKNHVLFMGADLAMEKDKVFHPVEDVTPVSLIIRPNGKMEAVPLGQTTSLQINEALKIASSSVGIEGLKAERAYTPGTDPYLKFGRALTLAAGESAVADLARMQASEARMGAMGASGNSEEGRSAVAKSDAAEQAVRDLYDAPSSALVDVATQSVAAENEASREEFDALRLSFDVTPQKDLGQPYYAVIAMVRDPDSKPGQVRKWAYVKSLGPISAGESKHVSFFRSGFTPGYILESYEVHVYNRGEELATNLSRKRVSLTEDEAVDFRIIEYVGANKGRTVPAMPATTTIPGTVRTTLTPEQLNETCYVRVTKDGRVAATFRDAAGKEPVEDPTLEAALKTYRFKPALNSGKPVEAIVPIKLDRLL